MKILTNILLPLALRLLDTLLPDWMEYIDVIPLILDVLA